MGKSSPRVEMTHFDVAPKDPRWAVLGLWEGLGGGFLAISGRERKREMIVADHVVLKKGNVVVPLKCTCCLADTGHLELVERSEQSGITTTYLSVKLPVCSACLKHRNVGVGRACLVVLGGVILFGIGGYLRSRPEAGAGTALYLAGEALVVLFLASLAIALIVYFWDRRRWARSHPPHVRAGRAVRVRLNGLFDVAFYFANVDYARAFRAANEANLSDSEKRKTST